MLFPFNDFIHFTLSHIKERTVYHRQHQIKDSLLKEKNIESSDYHIYPGSKWIVYYLNDDSDISTVYCKITLRVEIIRYTKIRDN